MNLRNSLILAGKTILIVASACFLDTARADSDAYNSSRVHAQIVGGKIVDNGDIIEAMTVALVQFTFHGVALCTGTLISSDLVLTAGHCVDEGKANLLIVFRRDIEGKGPVARAIGVLRHPLYDDFTKNDQNQYDIALIRFSGGIPAGYKTATLLEDASKISNGGEVTLAGYGETSVEKSAKNEPIFLRKTETTIQNAAYSQLEFSVDQSHGHGACHGDSGGPAFIKDSNGKYTVAGVTSRSPRNQPNDCTTQSIYSNVTQYMDFIKDGSDFLRKTSQK